MFHIKVMIQKMFDSSAKPWRTPWHEDNKHHITVNIKKMLY